MSLNLKKTFTALFMLAVFVVGVMATVGQQPLANDTNTQKLSRSQLTPAQINRFLIGRELSGRVFAFNTTALYSRNGRLTVKTPFGTARGTWAFSKTGLCLDITSGPRKGKTCMTVSYLGDGLFKTSRGNTFRIKG